MNPPPPPAASLKNGDAPAHQPSSSSAAKKNDDNMFAVQNENVPNARVTDPQGGATTTTTTRAVDSYYSKLTKKQLQELCQQRGLPKYGKNKAQIIARLVAGKKQAKLSTASRNKATKKSSSKVLSSKKKQSSSSSAGSSSGLTCAEFMGAAMYSYAALMARIFSSFPAEDQARILRARSANATHSYEEEELPPSARGGGGSAGGSGSSRRPS